MTEEELNRVEEAVQVFLTKTRDAYREMRASLPPDIVEASVYVAQDRLSLYSPWMNARG